jgi:uncharacterized protein YdaU (DUF1376 family)
MQQNSELTALVQRAAELRQRLEGRLPERVYWAWKDFLVGTAAMPVLALGAYMRLLHWQLDKGSVPADAMRMCAAIGGVSKAEALQLWEAWLLPKFHLHEGAYYNVRMLQEFIAAAEALLGKRERGRKGGQRSAEARKSEEPF